jgi:mono/diheme cytochrome c family protein
MNHRAFACLILVLVGLAALVWAGSAQSCPVVPVRVSYPSKKVVIVEEVPYVQLVPITIAVPSYSVGYDAPGAQMLQELQALRAEVQRMRQGAIPTPAPGAAPPVPRQDQPQQTSTRSQRGALVLQQKCARCHDGTAEKGGKHVLFAAGKLLNVDQNAGLILDRIDLPASDPKHMPKDGTLSDREFADVTWSLTVREGPQEEPKKP